MLCNGAFSPEHLPFLSLLELHSPLQGLPSSVLVGEQAATKQCTYTCEEEKAPLGPYQIPLCIVLPFVCLLQKSQLIRLRLV